MHTGLKSLAGAGAAGYTEASRRRAANFIWLFSLSSSSLPSSFPPSFYQRGLAGLEGAVKELEGPELLAASDKVWEARGPRPGHVPV